MTHTYPNHKRIKPAGDLGNASHLRGRAPSAAHYVGELGR